MKKIGKILAIILAVTTMLVILCSCNMQTYDWFDSNYGYTNALVCIGGEWRDIEIERWAYSNFEGCVAIEPKRGEPFVVHTMNCILYEKESPLEYGEPVTDIKDIKVESDNS